MMMSLSSTPGQQPARASTSARLSRSTAAGFAAALALLATTPAAAVQIVTSFSRSSEASVRVDGLIVDSESVSPVAGPALSDAIYGNPVTPTEARASGRADDLSITSNAEFDSRDPSFANFEQFDVFSSATILLEGTSLTGGDVIVDFLLPAGFLELRGQAEVDPGSFISTASISAQLQLSTPDVFGDTASVLSFSAELSGDFYNQSIQANASSGTLGAFPFGGPPSPLDVSPLENTTLMQVDSTTPDFIPVRTTTWEYPSFEGQVNLGSIPTGQPFLLSYNITARVVGGGPLLGAIAAINDPFNVTQVPSPTVDQLPIPEPGTALLMGLGLCMLGATRAKRD